VGQANETLCKRCEPGSFGPRSGLASCFTCPSGSYASDFGSDGCTICPEGTWTFSGGAMRATDCTPCRGSLSCLAGASVRISVQFMGFDFEALGADVHSMLSVALASDISKTIGVPVVDLFDQANSATLESARVAGVPGVKVSVFATVRGGSSANVMATELYNASFRSLMVTTAEGVLQRAGKQTAVLRQFSAPVVAVKPERFVPREHTTLTTTSTMTTTSTSTIRNLRSTIAAGSSDGGRGGGAYHDMSTTSEESEASTSHGELSSPVSAAASQAGVPLAALTAFVFCLM